MKKLIAITLALGIVAYALAAPKSVNVTMIPADGTVVTSTVTFTAVGPNLKTYTTATDITLRTISYTNAAQYMNYIKFATTTVQDYPNLVPKNGVVTMTLLASNTNTVYLFNY